MHSCNLARNFHARRVLLGFPSYIAGGQKHGPYPATLIFLQAKIFVEHVFLLVHPGPVTANIKAAFFI